MLETPFYVPVHIERIDPLAIDDATAEEMAAVSNEAVAVDGHDVPTVGPALAAMLRYRSDNRPVDGVWLATSDDGELVGWATLELPMWDNPEMAALSCSVRPSARGKGVGTALLGLQSEAAQEAGRNLLMTFVYRDSATSRLLLEHGFEVAQLTAMRRLAPKQLNFRRIEALALEAATAASDYDIVELDGPTPEPLLLAMSTLFEAINDAPVDGASLEAMAYPVERVRSYEAAMAARRQHVYRLLARHRRTEEWAGLTILCVDELRPGVAKQEDTSVVPAHRGHRLGLLLKARMLLWMRERHPELATIDTWNADTNTHMIAVNEALGCTVVARAYLLQRRLAPA
jgi:GNAT superfamily N-acetyltransferase